MKSDYKEHLFQLLRNKELGIFLAANTIPVETITVFHTCWLAEFNFTIECILA